MLIMKKYIPFIAAALLAVFASCSNDEITISKTVNFTVNPSGVASAFAAAEVYAGDLESFHSDCRLNVELYIYDAQGSLVQQFTKAFTNYAVQMKASAYLAQGSYTAVAITHIDDIVDDIHYWKISNTEKLEGLRITDGGYIGGENKVLGVAAKTFTVGENTKDISIKVEPAGSVTTVYFRDIHALETSIGIKEYTLEMNKTMNYLEFDRSGATNVVAMNNNGSYDWIFARLTTENFPSSTNIYTYQFTLPMTNVGLQFYGYTDSSYYTIGSSTTFNTKAGKSYYAILQLDSNVSNITVSFGSLTSSAARIDMRQQYVKAPYTKAAYAERIPQSMRVVDLVK